MEALKLVTEKRVLLVRNPATNGYAYAMVNANHIHSSNMTT